jgi:hypothetical protein
VRTRTHYAESILFYTILLLCTGLIFYNLIGIVYTTSPPYVSHYLLYSAQNLFYSVLLCSYGNSLILRVEIAAYGLPSLSYPLFLLTPHLTSLTSPLSSPHLASLTSHPSSPLSDRSGSRDRSRSTDRSHRSRSNSRSTSSVRSTDSKGNNPVQQDQQRTVDTGNNVRASHVRTQQNRTQNFNQNMNFNSDQNQNNNQNHSSDGFQQSNVNRFQQISAHQSQQNQQQHTNPHQQHQQHQQQQHEFNPQNQGKKIVLPDRDMKGRFCFEMQSKGEKYYYCCYHYCCYYYCC